MDRNPVTLADLAAASGVSLTTASRALSGRGRVSPTTRERVLLTAQRLDFHPNELARSFATGRSLTIGVLSYNAEGSFSYPLLTGIAETLGRAQNAVLVRDGVHDWREFLTRFHELGARRVDGLLIVGDGPDLPTPDLPSLPGVPTISVYTHDDSPAAIVVTVDQERIGELAAEHLLHRGRRHLLHITANRKAPAVRDRLAGFRRILRRNKVAAPQVVYGSWRRESGVRAIRAVLANADVPDGIFCGNDNIALGVYRELERAGHRVPEDVDLVGVDNRMFDSDRAEGLLTTVDPDLYGLGVQAATTVLNYASTGQRPPASTLHQPRLIRGVTTAQIIDDPTP